MSAVEEQKYHISRVDKDMQKEGLGTLLERSEHFNMLPAERSWLEIPPVDAFSSGRGFWNVYKARYSLDEFPEGQTRVDLTLGQYHNSARDETHVALDISPGGPGLIEFGLKLDQLTKNYIERPGLLGFPSRFLSDNMAVFYFMVPPTLLGAGLGLQTHFLGDPGFSGLTGTALGLAVGVSGGLAACEANDQHAKKGVEPLSDIHINGQVQPVLKEIFEHPYKTAVKMELWQSLVQEGIDLEAETFLSQVYSRLEPQMVTKRLNELIIKDQPEAVHGLPLPTPEDHAQERIIEYAKLLLTQDSIVQQQRKLLETASAH